MVCCARRRRARALFALEQHGRRRGRGGRRGERWRLAPGGRGAAAARGRPRCWPSVVDAGHAEPRQRYDQRHATPRRERHAQDQDRLKARASFLRFAEARRTRRRTARASDDSRTPVQFSAERQRRRRLGFGGFWRGSRGGHAKRGPPCCRASCIPQGGTGAEGHSASRGPGSEGGPASGPPHSARARAPRCDDEKPRRETRAKRKRSVGSPKRAFSRIAISASRCRLSRPARRSIAIFLGACRLITAHTTARSADRDGRDGDDSRTPAKASRGEGLGGHEVQGQAQRETEPLEAKVVGQRDPGRFPGEVPPRHLLRARRDAPGVRPLPHRDARPGEARAVDRAPRVRRGEAREGRGAEARRAPGVRRGRGRPRRDAAAHRGARARTSRSVLPRARPRCTPPASGAPEVVHALIVRSDDNARERRDVPPR